MTDWEQLDDSQYEELFQELKTSSWDKALSKVLLKHWGEYLAAYNTSPERYTFLKELLPDISNAVALDLGCSFGNTSFALAKRCKKVVAADTPPNIIRWLKAVKEKDSLANLEPVKIDNLDFNKLPFEDGTFALVIFGMTLQWIGSFNASKSPDEIQKSVLKDIFRILKKGGIMVFFDKNRYTYNYFLDEPDGSAIKYATLLPRKLANPYAYIYRRLFLKQDKFFQYIKDVSLSSSQYRNYKHTYPYLEKLFKNCGFEKTYSFIPLPGVKFQQLFIPLKDEKKAESLFAKWFKDKALPAVKGHLLAKLFFKLAIRFGFSRYLADGYLIMAAK